MIQCCVTTIDHGEAMMQQSEALIDHFSVKNDALLCNNNRSWLCHDATKRSFDRSLDKSSDAFDHSSRGGVIHCCVTTIDHGCAMMYPSYGGIDQPFRLMQCCVTTIDHGEAMMQQSKALIDHLMNQVMHRCVTTIDHGSAMMQQSEALIDHLKNQVMHPSRGGIDHSSSGGVMHRCVTTIDHGSAMMHPSRGKMHHLSEII